MTRCVSYDVCVWLVELTLTRNVSNVPVRFSSQPSFSHGSGFGPTVLPVGKETHKMAEFDTVTVAVVESVNPSLSVTVRVVVKFPGFV